MVHRLVKYKVKSGSVETTRSLVRKFVNCIKENEPNTLVYNSYQDQEDNSVFIHVMIFIDEEAEELHRMTDYVKKFSEELYPECEIKPEFTNLNLVSSKSLW